MIKIREAIIVEGRYDANIVRQLVDTVVLETGGFRIFNDKDRINMFRRIAETRGILILTDSDGAGLVIRNYLQGVICKGTVKHAYIPEIMGKERRKRQPSKEGTLGVEGMKPNVVLQALQRAGATLAEPPEIKSSFSRSSALSKSDLYSFGLSGGEGSQERRKKLLARLDLPHNLSANALLNFLNAVSDREHILEILKGLE